MLHLSKIIITLIVMILAYLILNIRKCPNDNNDYI